MEQIKVEWCENFIKAAFGKHHPFAGQADAGIECSCFWNMAERAGLWKPGIYNGPMSKALEKLCVIESVQGVAGEFLYNVFRLAQ